MSALGPTSRSLLAAARGNLGDPDSATAARVRAKIAASVGGVAVSRTAESAAASVAARSTLAVKLVLLAAIVTTTVIVDRYRTAAGAPDVPGPPSPAVTFDDEPHGHIHVASTETHPPLEHTATPRAITPVIAAPTLAREVELVDRAMTALRVGHFAAALQILEIFESETAGRGQLGEDAAAIAIEAHCRLHDPVTHLLEAFDRTWPSSAQRARLTTACGK